MQATAKTNPFDWEIVEKPISSGGMVLDNYKAIFRGGERPNLLNVAKKSYTPTPNARFGEVVSELNKITGFPIECYDEFQGGRKVLAFLKCTEPIKVAGYEFKDYMLVGNSHDSSTGFFIGNSSMMVRCQNRFSKVFRQLQVRHTSNHDAQISQLLQYFKVYMAERKALFAQMERFSAIKIDQSIKDALIKRLVRMGQEEALATDEFSARKRNLVLAMQGSINLECNELGNNLFGLLNGITHYTTHVKKMEQPKVFGNAFGSLARINEQAYEFCEEYAR